MILKEKLIEIIYPVDIELVDALEFKEITDTYLQVSAETRERLMDLISIIFEYDSVDEDNEEFLNNTKMTLCAKTNTVEFKLHV